MRTIRWNMLLRESMPIVTSYSAGLNMLIIFAMRVNFSSSRTLSSILLTVSRIYTKINTQRLAIRYTIAY